MTTVLAGGTAAAAPQAAPRTADQIRAQVLATHPAFAGGQVQIDTTTLARTGKTVHRVKAVGATGQQHLRTAFDGDGIELPDRGAALKAAEAHAAWLARGGVTAALADRMTQAGTAGRIPVAIWLRSSEPPVPAREEFQNPYALEADRALRDAAHAAVKSAFAAEAAQTVSAPVQDIPGVPALTAELTAAEIQSLAWSPRVGWIDQAQPEQPLGTRVSWQDSTLAAPAVTGKYGSNEQVCVVEHRRPQAPAYPPKSGVYPGDNYQPLAQPDDSFDCKHARAVAGAIQTSSSPAGDAPQCNLLLANWESLTFAYSLNWCANYAPGNPPVPAPVYTWNFSYTCDHSTLCAALMDYWGSHPPWPLITLPAGRILSGTSAPVTNLAWNTLTVGGTDDKNTGAVRADDTIDPQSCDLNPHILWELPQVVAPTVEQSTDGQTDVSVGTSIASAQVAGLAAQVQQTNPGLHTWPEPVRALLICSADQDVDGGRLDLLDSVDDRDGAGEVDGVLAVQMASSANLKGVNNAATARGYGYGSLYDGPAGQAPGNVPAGTYWSNIYSARFDGDPNIPNPRMRVVLTFDAHVTCSDVSGGGASCVDDATHFLDADIDLYVFRHSDGAMVAYSTTSWSNWEFVEFVPTIGTQYDIKIFVSNWSAPHTYYGIAWNTGTYPVHQP